MKKIFTSFLAFLLLFICVSCGNNSENVNTVDVYDSLCSQLSQTSMSGTEYSAAQIDELEARFTKMNLSAGFAKVNHFRSTSEYAYVIKFENAEDAQSFFEKIGTAKYNVKKFDSIVVYGVSNSIDELE